MSTTQTNQTPIKKYYSINELTALGIGSRTKIDRLAKQGLLKKSKLVVLCVLVLMRSMPLFNPLTHKGELWKVINI